jgi:hypothetical protein
MVRPGVIHTSLGQQAHGLTNGTAKGETGRKSRSIAPIVRYRTLE